MGALSDLIAERYEREVDRIAPLIESQSGVSFRGTPEVIAGGLEVLIPFAERKVYRENKFAQNPKSNIELKVGIHEFTDEAIEKITLVYDPTSDSIIVNEKNKRYIPDAADIAYALVSALQYQVLSRQPYMLLPDSEGKILVQKKEILAMHDLGMPMNVDTWTAVGIALGGQRIHLTHQVMKENGYLGKDYADSYRRVAGIISLSPREIYYRMVFEKNLRDANSKTGRHTGIGYTDLLKTEVEYHGIIAELNGLCLPEIYWENSMKDNYIQKTFNTFSAIGLMRRVGYQFNRDLAQAGIPAEKVMARIPTSLSEVNIEFYQ